MQIVLQSNHENLRQLTSQKSENEAVKIEFENLEPEANIWKQTGPLMVRQDRYEAKHNVEKRLEFITAELMKVEEEIKRTEQEFEVKRKELLEIQSQFKQTVS
jgi:prefoldin beta subunit